MKFMVVILVAVLAVGLLTGMGGHAHRRGQFIDISKGLNAYFRMDETSGTTLKDSSGNGFNATLIGLTPSTDSVPGQVGTALEFNGFSDYADTGARIIDNVNLTWVYWANPDAPAGTGQHGVIYQGSGSGDLGTNVREDDLFLNLRYNAGPTRSSSANSFSLNNWYHSATTHEFDGTGDFYIDGDLDTAYAGTVTTDPNAGNTYIGTWYDITQTTRRYSGILDDVRIYSRALTAEEVKCLALKQCM